MNNEPVAELVLEQMSVGDASSLRVKWLVDNYPPVGTKLYTHPVKDLEDIDINITWNENSMRDFGKDELAFARAILRKAQEK